MPQACPRLFTDGVCNQENCPFPHTIFSCEKCGRPFGTEAGRNQHINSSAHPRKAQANAFSCTLCSVFCSNRGVYDIHVLGRNHQRKLKASGLKSVEPEERQIPPNCRACDVCRITVHEKIWDGHIRARRHLLMQRCLSLANALDETEDDKHDILVDGDSIDFGIVDFVVGSSVIHTKIIKVTNSGAATVILVEARVFSRRSGNVFRLKKDIRRLQLNRTCGTSVGVVFEPQEKGRFEDRLELVFESPTQKRRFTITRPILATVGSKADHEALKASRPYVRPKRNRVVEITEVEEGVPPPALAETKWAIKLELYKVPQSIVNIAFKENEKPGRIAGLVRSMFMPGAFHFSTHARHLQVMLWIEEEQVRRDLATYDLEKADLDPNGSYFHELYIEGLAEKRPSVIVSDRILARPFGSSERWYAGYVHVVKDKSVLLHFSPKFKGIKGQKYEIHFELNRLVSRRLHQALLCEPFFERVTFPSAIHAKQLQVVSNAVANSVKIINPKISSNPPQIQAVATILRMPPGSIPFIVFGPPGTGKTVTIVEAIRQIVDANPDARVLACAPSNSAADLIAEALSELGEKALIRLIAYSRNKKEIAKSILKFTRVNDRGVFVCPPRAELEKFRVVVSTRAGDGTGNMIPIKTMSDAKTNIILSGDVKQLGPIVRSAVARELGLGMSYLDRLMGMPLYDEVGGRGVTLVKLTKNWRSHPAILKFPNDEFYRGDLEACADQALTHSICGRWDGLVKKDFPIIFYGISGKDEREASSPSYFNVDEATIVKEYVKSLLTKKKDLRLKPKDIGVISPYRAQVGKIRQLLISFAKETSVGSVEEYQGQERQVIIVSTVRSSTDLISFDLRHTLGFVANPRRFNVAVTRAQALLIVIGDPYVLALDPLWKAFINYVHLGGGYKGSAIDWDPNEPVDRTGRLDEARRAQGLSELEELIQRTREMELIDSDDEDAGAINQPWREE